MLARPSEMTRVLNLCQTALQIVEHSNPARVTSSGDEIGTFIAHAYDVKIVLCIPLTPYRTRLLDIWHNRSVLSVEWNPRGAQIIRFHAGNWEDRLRHAADAIQPRQAVGWS